MMRIDRWVGVPLCFALTCWKAVFPGRKDYSGVRRILFVKMAEQGSTVLAHEALRDAVERVGRENVYMVVFEDNRFILDVLDVIPRENVVPLKSDSLTGLIHSSILALIRLRRLGVDAAIDLEFFARSSALFAAMSGARLRVGFHAFFGEGPYRGNLMTHRVRYNPHLHTTETFAMLVAALDAPVEKLPQFDYKTDNAEDQLPQFAPAPGETEEVEKILGRFTALTTAPPLILLNANASDLIPLRRWDPARYVELARRLLDHYPEVHIAFTGDEESAPKVASLVAQVGSNRCFSLAGLTTLRQLIVLYTLADVLVTNDSGPAHFASLTTIHTVTLFGPETPFLFAARTPRNKPLWAGIACSPCVSALNNRQSACKENVCMARISVGQVFTAVCESYEERNGLRSEETSVPALKSAE